MPSGRPAACSTAYADGREGEAGFCFALHRDGTVASAVRDSYTHAFVLFGLAGAYRLSGEPRLKRAIERTLGFVDNHLTDPRHGGLHDRHPGPAAAKAQNPQMHLLEAYLALHQACPEGPYLERAGALVDLFGRRMVREPGCLPEHFAADWSDHADPEVAESFEPGHHFEWCWLLDGYRAASGQPLPDAAERLWTSARECGGDGAGRLFDAVGFDRRPRVSTHRLWPHAEGVKAAATRLEAGDAAAAGVAAAMLRTLNGLFLGRPFAGGWVDRVGPGGEALLDSVPASSLYHLYGAWAEADRVFGSAAPVGPAGPASRPR